MCIVRCCPFRLHGRILSVLLVSLRVSVVGVVLSEEFDVRKFGCDLQLQLRKYFKRILRGVQLSGKCGRNITTVRKLTKKSRKPPG